MTMTITLRLSMMGKIRNLDTFRVCDPVAQLVGCVPFGL